MASERTSHLTLIFSQPVWEGKRERERKKKRILERESTFFLNFPVVGPSNFGETRGKVDPTARATRGYWYCGVSTIPGGKDFSPTRFSSYLRTIQMVGVIGAEKAVWFGSLEWD